MSTQINNDKYLDMIQADKMTKTEVDIWTTIINEVSPTNFSQIARAVQMSQQRVNMLIAFGNMTVKELEHISENFEKYRNDQLIEKGK